ncbi:MAG: hypothetical protein CME21_07190 [Gemmatimonadetes bacterium]|nr:hypothetical protein [Gemmatimonadota bacterium]
MTFGAGNASSSRQEVLDRLGRARTRHTLLRALAALATLATTLVIGATGVIGLESILYLSPIAKITALLAALLTCSIGIVWGLLLPLIKPQRIESTARLIESAHGGLDQHLTNAVQLWGQRQESAASKALIEAAIRQAAYATQGLDFAASIDHSQATKACRRLVLAALAGVIAIQLFPGGSLGAIERLSDPTGQYTRPRDTRIRVSPGDTTLIVGDSLTVTTSVSGIVPVGARLLLQKEDEEAWSTLEIPIREARAAHDINPVRGSFVYRWEAHDAISELYFVLAKPRPVVLSVTIRYSYPPYTRLPERIDHEGGDIATIKGTEMHLQIRSSRNLREAWLGFEDGTRLTADVSGDSAHAAFRVSGPARFTIGLVDTAGIMNAAPVTYRVMTLEDEAPRIALLRPGGDSEMSESMKIPLLFEATDDFGIAKVDLVYRVNQDETTTSLTIQLDRPNAPEVSQPYLWDLAVVDLLPGDHVYCKLVVTDTNTMTGPGVGETREFVIRFPSLHEIQKTAQNVQEEIVEQLQETAERNLEIQKRLENVARRLTKSEEATWEDQAEVREAIKEQKALQEQIDRNIEALDQAKNRMEQSGLLSRETLDKIAQVRSLMQSLRSPDFDRLTEDLNRAMNTADPELIQEAMERLTSEQEAFQAKLDRTIALLEHVRNEQMLDALAARLRTLADDQQEISSQIKATEALDSLTERQDAQTREAKNLDDALKDAAEAIESPGDQLGNLSEDYDRASIPKRSAQSSRDLKAQKRERARKGTKQLAEDMTAMADRLEDVQETYRQSQKTELLEQLAGIFQDLMNLSQSQERTATEARRGARRSEQEALSRRQTRDLNGTSRLADRIDEADKRTFLIPPQAGSATRNAIIQMQKSMGHLQRGLGDQASSEAREAMAGLNSAGLAIREAIAAVQSAGTATGLDEMLKQLAEASEMQGDLNAQTESAVGQPQPGGSQLGGSLARLSAEQLAIQKMLDDLREKFGTQEGQTLGDLGRVSEDMADVARRLSRNQLDPTTTERQQQILSRMLDAQRSIRQRGFSNDREARTGTDIAHHSPGSLPQNLGEQSHPLRIRLRNALRDGYPNEAQTLIRRYFDRLIENAASGGQN